MLTRSITPDLVFAEAAARFVAMRSAHALPGAISARYVRENTEKAYLRHIASLELFFSGMRLGEIHWHHMRAYQAARVRGDAPFLRYRRPQDAKPRMVNGVLLPAKGKTPCPCKPQQANQETGFLKRLKTIAGCWTAEDETYFEDMQAEESDVPRALTPDEQTRWIDLSRCRERWNLVHWYSLVAFDTCCSTNELRGLRVGDVNLAQRAVRVPWASSKNRYRHRDIAVEDASALWALERILERAWNMGSREPLDYLFPFGVGPGSWDKSRAATPSFLKKAWNEVREASGLTWFRMYDTRHTAATRLAEQGVPIDVILARMGHANDRMRRHYTHISMQAQRRWLRPQPHTQHMYAPPVEAWPVSAELPKFAPGTHFSFDTKVAQR